MQRPRQLVFDVAWDEEADVAYLSPSDRSDSPKVAKTVPIIDRAQQLFGTVDLSSGGELIGIEMIGARRLLSGATGEGNGSSTSGS